MQLWDGWRWRQEQQENVMAYFTAAQMSVHCTKPVQPGDLLKPLRQSVKQKNRKEEEQALKEIFGLGGE